VWLKRIAHADNKEATKGKNMKVQTTVMLVAAAATVLVVAGCKSQQTGMGAAEAEQGQMRSMPSQHPSSETIATRPGVPGGVVVQTYDQTATISQIARDTRRLTLTQSDGTKITVKCAPQMANFDQIQVGDKVNATLTEQLVVFVRNSGEAPASTDTTTVDLTPVGAYPLVADTEEITCKVTAIDLPNHKATVQLPDGHAKTFKVRDDVDLSQEKIGENVVLRSTETMAIRVQRP
jgi:hypothetical protein